MGERSLAIAAKQYFRTRNAELYVLDPHQYLLFWLLVCQIHVAEETGSFPSRKRWVVKL